MVRGNHTINIPGLEKLGFLVANKQDLKDKVNMISRELNILRDVRNTKLSQMDDLIAEIEMIEKEELKSK